MNAMCTGSFGDSLCTWLPNNRIDGFPKLKVRKILDTTEKFIKKFIFIITEHYELKDTI